MKKGLVLLLIALLCIGFVACTNPVEFEINFVVDGNVYKTIQTTGNEAISIPQNPVKEGYTFDGWYWDEGEWEKPFTANSLLDAPLSSDMNVYAKWKHTHAPSDWIIDKDPTCAEKGSRHKVCTICNETVETEIIELSEHTPAEAVTENYVDSSCSETGSYDSVVYCQVCDKLLSSETITIEKKAHSESDWITDEKATCEDVGSKHKECTVCGETTATSTIDKLNTHTPQEAVKENVVDADCETDGSYDSVVYCSVCGIEISRDSKTIPALGHSYTPAVILPTCTEQGYTTYTCECGDSYVDSFTEALGHDEIEHEAKESTCISAGWDAYVTCSRCDYTTYKERPTQGHTEVIDEAVAPTCTKSGLSEGKHCSVCSAQIVPQTIIAPLGHNHIATVIAPTCNSKGYTVYTCHCGSSYEDEYVSALGHDEVRHDAKAPTCTEIGWNAYVTCSRCDYTTYTEKPALGHDEIKHDAKEPTCTEVGYEAYVTCSRCDYTTYVEIAALGHKYSEVITAPTCIDEGYTTYTCYCGYSYIGSFVDSIGHDKIHHDAKEPTCTEIGWEAYSTCSRCDYSTEKIIPALGHDEINHEGKLPTCTEKGWESYVTCSRCNYTTYKEIGALGHGDNEVYHYAKEPTCTEVGWDDYVTCIACNYTTYVEKPALGHSYTESVTSPTCTDKGYTTHTCHCGDSYVDSYVAALGHSLINHPGKEPTCTEIGYDAYVNCSNCDYSTYVEKASLGHNIVVDEYVAPTCTATGLTEGKHCSTCKTVIIAQTVISALGHTEVIDIAVAPTCTETGLTEGAHCSVCSAILVAQQIVDATGHNHIPTVIAPTCTAKGYTTYTCHCGSSYIENYVDALGHTEVIDEAIAPTCTNTGLTEGKHCSVCGEVLLAQTIVSATGHDYIPTVTAPTCTTKGYTTYACHCGKSYQDEFVSALGHSEVIDAGTLPTCTESGITDGKHCSVCGEITVKQTTILPLGHTAAITPAVAPTCTKSGLTEGKHCSVCSTILVAQQIVDATGHNHIPTVTAPNCTEKGYTTYTCHCGSSYVENYVDALGHTEVIDEAVAPTCTTGGLTEGKHCSACNEVLVAQTVVNALGHVIITENGISICERCGASGCESLGHSLELSTSGSITYTCSSCNKSYSLDKYFYFDGSSYDGMTGVNNYNNGYSSTTGNLPATVTEDGNTYYQLLNLSGSRTQYQLWIPHGNLFTDFADFSCANSAVGYISFRINAYTSVNNSPVDFKIIDGRYTSVWNWSNCAASIFQVFSPDDNDVAVIKGMGGTVLKNIQVGEDNFTGWMDVKMAIQLSSDNTITVYYYIDGEYVAKYSGKMPILTNAIGTVYFSGYSDVVGSGFMFDDFVFGFSTGKEWELGVCEHEWADATCTTPKKCGLCGVTDGAPLGHKGGTATCTELAECEVCGVEYGDYKHNANEATCGQASVCADCGIELAPALPHPNLTWTYEDGVAKYSCPECKSEYNVDKNYHFDGTDSTYKNMVSVDENNIYNTVITTNPDGTEVDTGSPIINSDGQYEYINNMGAPEVDADGKPLYQGKATIWIPCMNGGIEDFEDFSCEKNAKGFYSFSINAYCDKLFEMQLVDTDLRIAENRPEGKDFWSSGAQPTFFKISTPDANGNVNVTGLDSILLTTITVGEDKFTGWFDVTVGIELTTYNKIILDYYIDGEYVTSITKDLAIVSGKIDGVYFQIKAHNIGAGVKFDNLVFGYGTKNSWEIEHEHIVVIDEAIAPTCTETGLTEGKHCSVCGEVFIAQTIVSATGHNYGSTVIAPTCTTKGFTAYACHCGKSYKDEFVSALGHTEVIDAGTLPTCTESGITDGKHCSVCDEVLVKQTTISPLGHTVAITPAVAPTCTKSGLTEGTHCSVCNEVLVAQKAVDALGHDFNTTSNTGSIICSVCGYYSGFEAGSNEIVEAIKHPAEDNLFTRIDLFTNTVGGWNGTGAPQAHVVIDPATDEAYFRHFVDSAFVLKEDATDGNEFINFVFNSVNLKYEEGYREYIIVEYELSHKTVEGTFDIPDGSSKKSQPMRQEVIVRGSSAGTSWATTQQFKDFGLGDKTGHVATIYDYTTGNAYTFVNGVLTNTYVNGALSAYVLSTYLAGEELYTQEWRVGANSYDEFTLDNACIRYTKVVATEDTIPAALKSGVITDWSGNIYDGPICPFVESETGDYDFADFISDREDNELFSSSISQRNGDYVRYIVTLPSGEKYLRVDTLTNGQPVGHVQWSNFAADPVVYDAAKPTYAVYEMDIATESYLTQFAFATNIRTESKGGGSDVGSGAGNVFLADLPFASNGFSHLTIVYDYNNNKMIFYVNNTFAKEVKLIPDAKFESWKKGELTLHTGLKIQAHSSYGRTPTVKGQTFILDNLFVKVMTGSEAGNIAEGISAKNLNKWTDAMYSADYEFTSLPVLAVVDGIEMYSTQTIEAYLTSKGNDKVSIKFFRESKMVTNINANVTIDTNGLDIAKLVKFSSACSAPEIDGNLYTVTVPWVNSYTSAHTPVSSNRTVLYNAVKYEHSGNLFGRINGVNYDGDSQRWEYLVTNHDTGDVFINDKPGEKGAINTASNTYLELKPTGNINYEYGQNQVIIVDMDVAIYNREVGAFNFISRYNGGGGAWGNFSPSTDHLLSDVELGEFVHLTLMVFTDSRNGYYFVNNELVWSAENALTEGAAYFQDLRLFGNSLVDINFDNVCIRNLKSAELEKIAQTGDLSAWSEAIYSENYDIPTVPAIATIDGKNYGSVEAINEALTFDSGNTAKYVVFLNKPNSKIIISCNAIIETNGIDIEFAIGENVYECVPTDENLRGSNGKAYTRESTTTYSVEGTVVTTTFTSPESHLEDFVTIVWKYSDDEYYVEFVLPGNEIKETPFSPIETVPEGYNSVWYVGDEMVNFLDNGKHYSVTENTVLTFSIFKPEFTYAIVDSVSSVTLNLINEAKIKQFDGCDLSVTDDDKSKYGYYDKEGGKAVFVKTKYYDKTVEALYFSRTVEWNTAVTDSNASWAEHRYTLDSSRKLASFSFDYLILGTVEKHQSVSGESYGEGIFQIKYTDASTAKLGLTDSYKNIEYGNDTFKEDGAWHRYTYIASDPVELDSVLIKLYQFLGEMLIANIEIEYAPLDTYNADGTLNVNTILKENVSNAGYTLTTIVDSKIKQFDQTAPATGGDYSYGHFVKEGGTSVFVNAVKDGELVEALYFSRSKDKAWTTYPNANQNAGFSEFRFDTKGAYITGFSFDYLVKGTTEERDEYGADFDGTAVYLGHSYVQVKSNGNYYDMPESALITDGEWHTMTIEFSEAKSLDNIITKIQKFIGEMVVSNLVIEYAE